MAHRAVPLRDQIVSAAAEVTVDRGWQQVTMADLAQRVGVSRQTVYNEVGTKPELAEALVVHELSKFLVLMQQAFAASRDDAQAGFETAVRLTLVEAGRNPLLQAVVGASYGASSELIPLITTQSGRLVELAGAALEHELDRYELALSEEERAGLIDTVARVVLSHCTQPSASPEEVARTLGWLFGRHLR